MSLEELLTPTDLREKYVLIAQDTTAALVTLEYLRFICKY